MKGKAKRAPWSSAYALGLALPRRVLGSGGIRRSLHDRRPLPKQARYNDRVQGQDSVCRSGVSAADDAGLSLMEFDGGMSISTDWQ